MHFMNFLIDSETGTCANTHGNLSFSNPSLALVVEDALKHVSEKSIKMNYSWIWCRVNYVE
jgi:hypothetical protein